MNLILAVYNEYKRNKNSKIRYYNFWKDQLPHEMWFSKFIQNRGINTDKTINFYSVLGPIEIIKHQRKGVNIFFSGENLQAERFEDYKKLRDKNTFDLYLDFNEKEDEKHLRFPLWLHYIFPPDSTYNDVKQKVAQLNETQNKDREKFCSLVAGHDFNGIRGKIFSTLADIDEIDSGGGFLHNNDDLRNKYNNVKHDFICNYKFNICPENSDSAGYVTEKIFQSIAAGCIPVYWGANGNPEPDILNKNAIIFWNENNFSDTKKIISEINCSKSVYYDFISQPRFLPNAENVVWQYFEKLETKLRNIL
ncbi:MAG: hypothetical protein LBS50_08445 [Prevotellaceae bacterium]|jgi:hypothetical protein|nr:hypothetical protein [Prevotellaceae bacterium]